jgi:zinc D-Ala-D-Ala carboxypeptidase
VNLFRRRLLIAALAASVASACRPPRVRAQALEPDLATLRGWIGAAVERDSSGTVTRVFDIDQAVAGDVFLLATRSDALPDGYAPTDLVSAGASGIASAGRQLLRALIVDDTRALIAEAASEGHDLYVGSGFRSQAYQEVVFAAQVNRWGDEDTANRYSARPGHSQHQLGTTIDFTNTFRGFRESPAADWLRDNAHRFGFILPYTVAATNRTGYIDEPWHARWVSQSLATRLRSANYQDWSSLDADDVIALLRTEAALDAA